MAKIPLYNQGRGLVQQTPVGELSRSPNIGAFTAPAKALGDIAKTAGDIAFNFGMAERDREDKRIVDEEYNAAAAELIEHKFQDKSTTVDEAKKNFKTVEDNIKNKFKGKNYGTRRENLISQSLSKLINSQRFSSMQDSFDRGQTLAATNSDLITEKQLDSLKGLSPNDPMFDLVKDLAINNITRANKLSLPTKYNLINLNKSIDDIVANNTRSDLSEQIRNTKNKENLPKLIETINKSKLQAATKTVLINQVNTRELEIDNEIVVDFGNFLPVEEVDKTSFGTVDGMNEAIFNLEKNGKIYDPSLQAKWDKADNVQRKKILLEMRGRVKQAKDNIVYEQAKKNEIQETNNENLFDNFMEKINNGTTTIKEVKAADWQGVNGIKIRDSLIDKIADAASGKVTNDSTPNVYKEIHKKILDGEITDTNTVFTLAGESKGVSLIDRMNDSISQPDFTYFRGLIKDVAKAPTAAEAAERLDGLKRFEQFLDSNKKRVQGMYKNLNPNAETDFYYFTVQMRKRFMKQMDAYFERQRQGKAIPGETLLDFLDPQNTDKYILRDGGAGFFPTTEKVLKNFSESLKKKSPVTDFNPPPKPQGMSVEDYLKSPAYQTWKTSGRYILYMENKKKKGN